MLQMLGMQPGSSANQRYKYGWQQFEKVRWLQSSSGLLLPVIEQPAQMWKRAAQLGLPAVSEADFVAFVNGNVRIWKGGKRVKVPVEEASIGPAENNWKVIFNPPGADALEDQVESMRCPPTHAAMTHEHDRSTELPVSGAPACRVGWIGGGM